MIKQRILPILLLSISGAAMAQTQIETYSVYDVNHKDGITQDDATAVANRVVEITTTDPQVVEAVNLKEMLLDLKQNIQNLAARISVISLGISGNDIDQEEPTTGQAELDSIAADPQMVDATTVDTLLCNLTDEYYEIESRISQIEKRIGIGFIAEGTVPYNGHEYVDLGIVTPYGKTLLWSPYNVGAHSPGDYGDHFAWGETVPYAEGRSFDWASYKYCVDSEKTLTKYCSSNRYGYKRYTDSMTELIARDDAAFAHYYGVWRMPTDEEMALLHSQCYWQQVEDYQGVEVRGFLIFKAKSDSDKGKCNDESISSKYSVFSDTHIFLPFAGYRRNTELKGVDTTGAYWTSTLSEGATYMARYIGFDDTSVVFDSSDRCIGYSVRPVCELAR